MGDKKGTKYKGKICSPDSTRTGAAKPTREWCRGKVGVEHDWWWFDSAREKYAGLSSEQYKKCRVCGKQPYEKRSVWHSFGTSVAAVRISKKLTQIQLSKRLGITESRMSAIESDANSPSLRLMEDIAEALGVALVVELQDKKEEGRWSYRPGIRIKDKKPD